MPLNKRISSDNAFTVITTLIIEFSLRCIALYLSFVHRSVESFDIYCTCIILAGILMAHIFKVEPLLLKLLVILHFTVAITIPMTYLLVTYQCLISKWMLHDIIFLPTLMKIMCSISVGTDFVIVLLFGLLFSSKMHPVCCSFLTFYQYLFFLFCF